jgi:uracil-DNA glycosylase family 4
MLPYEVWRYHTKWYEHMNFIEPNLSKYFDILIWMKKKQELEKIAQEIETCRECKENKEGVAVPGEGNPDANIMFIGEAPGRKEAESGRPFIGRSGQLLRNAIRGIGLREEDAYITSPVKYLPLHKTPNEEDILHGMTHLSLQIEIINPKVIVLLGNTAARGVLGILPKITTNHGTFFEKNGKTYFFSYHPAAAIRFQKFKKVFDDDFQKLKKFV